MKTFEITQPDKRIINALEDKINNLTKPKGSLGRLEEIAIRVGLITGSLKPNLKHPYNIIFAADHGIVEENISKSPKEVTWQVVNNFIDGGAGINYLCKQHGFKLVVVDTGVDYDFAPNDLVINRKIRKGTRSYLHEAAMNSNEFDKAIEIGCESVQQAYDNGCNIISFGEMGITNTAASSVWMSYLTGIPLDECVGAGSGLDRSGIEHKYKVLSDCMAHYKGDRSTEDIMRYFGGYEMVAATGAMLQAASLGMIILVDGFIMTVCMLAACKLYPETIEYAIFGHQGDEMGHSKLLHVLHAKPILHLGMRLGEGTGAVCAYPIIQSSVLMLHEMASFRKAEMTKYFA